MRQEGVPPHAAGVEPVDGTQAALDTPPASLVRRLAEVLGDGVEMHDADPARVADAYLDAAEALFEQLQHQGCATRDRALDLLTVDALVTYALEAAAERPEMLTERAHAAMVRFARMAESR